MPFRSKKQQRFMYATKPKGVDLKEWAEETDFDKLPEKVRKKKTKKKDKNDLEEVFELDANDPIVEVLTFASIYHSQVKLAFSGSDFAHLALDLAGFIPVVGEAADFANASMYANEGNYLFAALSLISMVPEVGDAIGKGTKALATIAEVSPNAAELVVKHGPMVAGAIKGMISVIKSNMNLIHSIFDKMLDNEDLQGYASQIKGALNAFIENTPDEAPKIED